MDTAHKTDEEKKEHFDSDKELDKKITHLAELIKASKHFIVFTGAGISTSAGIPDFRSGVNTVLPTGPGAWEKAAQGVKTNNLSVEMESAVPTPCHMALVKLYEAGYIKFLISQNTDGLHRKSGIPAKHLAEVHGNTNLEVCKYKNCKKQYLRDFETRTAQKVYEHKTGRSCENCGRDLYDSIINFGENLPERELNCGFEEGAKADLCLALGSSLRVTPAADMPLETATNGGKLVIVNLQSTPLDSKAIRINGLIDDVMGRLMKKLGLTIPAFTLKRRFSVTQTDLNAKTENQKSKIGIVVRGVDETGSPYSLFKSVKAKFDATKETVVEKKEPANIYSTTSPLDSGILKLELTTQGNYGEPVALVEIDLKSLKMNVPVYRLIEYDLQQKQWISCKEIDI